MAKKKEPTLNFETLQTLAGHIAICTAKDEKAAGERDIVKSGEVRYVYRLLGAIITVLTDSQQGSRAALKTLQDWYTEGEKEAAVIPDYTECQI